MQQLNMGPRGLAIPSTEDASRALSAVKNRAQALSEAALEGTQAATRLLMNGAADARRELSDGFELLRQGATALVENGAALGIVPAPVARFIGAKLGAGRPTGSILGASVGSTPRDPANGEPGVPTPVVPARREPLTGVTGSAIAARVGAPMNARIDFPNDGSWRSDVQGDLVAGQKVVVTYEPFRLSRAEFLQGGRPQWGVAGYYKLNDNPEVYFSAAEARGDRLVPKPKTIDLTEPGQLSLWFSATNRSGSHYVDTVFGQNYKFDVRAPA